jgi:hypothetical protein
MAQFERRELGMASSKKWESKDASFYLWVGLWLAALNHIGLTLWAILTTAQLPPGYQVPSAWVGLNLSPNPTSYWFYVIVLAANLVWESRWKGKGYVPSTFPFPDVLYGDVAAILWGVLWAFAHWGHSNGWFAVPDQIGHTFATCVFLWALQRSNVDNSRNPEEEAKEDKPQPTQVASVPAKTVQPQPAPKPVASGNNDSTQKLLDYIRQNGQAKTGAMAGVMGVNRRTVIRMLNKLIAEGRLVRQGNGPSAVYKINSSQKVE